MERALMANSVVGNLSAAGSMAAPVQPKPKNALEAAQQFEALMIGQMLRSAHESGGNGSLGPDSDESATSEPLLDLADQQLARLLANNGGFGLAKLIAKSLNQSTS
jgi:Rod binding domain-containing protein